MAALAVCAAAAHVHVSARAVAAHTTARKRPSAGVDRALHTRAGCSPLLHASPRSICSAGPGLLPPQNFAAVQAPLHGKRCMGRAALQQARRELHICSTHQNKTNQIYKLILHQRVNRTLLLSFARVAASATRGASADEDERLGCGTRMARVAGGGDGCRAAACAAAHASHSLTAAAATKARVA